MIIGSALQISADASLLSFDSLTALIALTAMEIVLGIDNIVFIAIVTGRLSPEKRSMARRVGLVLAMVPKRVDARDALICRKGPRNSWHHIMERSPSSLCSRRSDITLAQ